MPLRTFLRRLALVLAMAAFVPGAQAGPVDLVDPFIGTAPRDAPNSRGNVFPGAVVPNGMVAISPDTNPRYPGGYRSGAGYIEGFSQNHMSGVGCLGDLGNFLLAPTVGPIRTTERRYRSTYSGEQASPGHYRVDLGTWGVAAEMSATTRATIARFSFPARGGDANILLDVSHGLSASRGGSVRVVSASEVEGHNEAGNFCGKRQPYSVYFVARFSKPARATGTWNGGTVSAAATTGGSDIGAFFRFATGSGEAIEVRLGLSYVSIANARANLDAEIPPTRTFQDVRAAARARWDQDLGRIAVSGGTPAQQRIFYTALYHSLMHPSVFSDVNGQYPGMEGTGVRTARGYTRYHLFSLWDTYRSLHSLLTLAYPERQQDMLRSMVGMAEEGGWLPKWELAGRETYVMVGDPAGIVIADSYLKGIRGFDAEAAYAAMRRSATQTTGNPLRPCLAEYVTRGYLAQDRCKSGGNVSVTLEYAYADQAVAALAAALGKTADASLFAARALTYRRLFDPSTGFLRSRRSNGGWLSPFDPTCCALASGKYESPGYIEGTAWQYLFMAPHDMAGLKQLLGGDAAFVAKLAQAFTPAPSYYTLSNEPDMAYPYLFTYVPGAAWRTQAQVRRDLATSFDTTRAGLPGQDDAGQTSSRAVFDMLGFYPADPLSGTYQLGSPVFEEAIIRLDPAFYPGGTFTVRAPGTSAENLHVQSAELDGQALRSAHLAHATLAAGGTLTLRMGPNPSDWDGAAIAARTPMR